MAMTRTPTKSAFSTVQNNNERAVVQESSEVRNLVHQAIQIRRSRSINEELLERSLALQKKAPQEKDILMHLFDVDQYILETPGLDMFDKVQQQDIVLLTSRHVDVPNAELHLRMEAARKRSSISASAISGALGADNAAAASALIESVACEEDTSTSEKFAMKVIPQQLPGPVAKAVAEKSSLKGAPVTSAVARRKSKSKGLTMSEELRLVHLIHEGSKLNAIKTEFEAQHGREITRKEWANLADTSEKELRRLVAEYRAAKSTLVTANMGLVHAVVKNQYRNSFNGSTDLDKEMDLIQEGSLGLIRAAELFDPSKGVRFSTYATIWIKGVLSHNTNHQTITVPSREKAKWTKISKALKDHEEEDAGRHMSMEELSKTCGMTMDQVKLTLENMPKARNILSLDMEYNTHSRSGSSQSSSNNVGLYGDKAFSVDGDLAEVIQMRTDVVAALARNLDSREARLMRLRYGLHDGELRSITECAAAMGISKQRASQLAKGCLKKLREADEAESLQEYLLTVA
jgi:RNA polymerase sigma factor (sigma-70 family)